MNPYNQLAKIGGVLSLPAKLIKSDGTTKIQFYVKPEQLDVSQPGAEYVQALQIRTWSVNVQQLTDGDSVLYPEQGDSLIVKNDDGSLVQYAVTRSAETARYWDWSYTRPGYRVKFYTKFEGTKIVD